MSLWKKRKIDAYEEVEYEALTVLEILTEMKDLSELMTSLAYSALIFPNDPINEEVESMEQRMDWLKYQLRQTASLSVRTTEEAEQVAGILQIGDASEHIANAAGDMVEILDATQQTRPFLRRVLDDADDRIGTIRVPADSPGSGMSLGDLRLESLTGVRVIAIRRGRRWVYDPRTSTTLAEGDTMLVRGQREGTDHVAEWLRDGGEL